MTRMVTFEERVWTITSQPQVKGAAQVAGEHNSFSGIGGLWFLSDKGDKYFLPLKGGQLPTDKQLHALSLERVAGFLRRAMRQ
jgi:hypothetical protein